MTEQLQIFRGKRVLVTGHTGFKGSWLSAWLTLLGADVTGYSLDPVGNPNLFDLGKISDSLEDHRGDIRNKEQLSKIIRQSAPDIIFHLAAQALVLDGYEDPLYTFETNTMGTANILEAVRHSESVRAVVVVTTDKVYENKEWVWGYRENDPMGGYDPYSASKGAAELVTSSYRRSFFNIAKGQSQTAVASARAGNVIGGGDWSENRIVPDCVKAIENGRNIVVRNPAAIRPWQHVLEPLGGYLLLAAKMLQNAEAYADAWNFGPADDNIHTVQSLVNSLVKAYGKGAFEMSKDENVPHEAKTLTLDISKSFFELNWQPKLNFEETISWTADWYKNYREKSAGDLCTEQINKYMAL